MVTYLDTQMCTLYINYREIPVMIIMLASLHSSTFIVIIKHD